MPADKITFTGLFRRDPASGAFLAHCPELDIDTEGRDLDQASEMLEEAIALYLETAEEEGAIGALIERLSAEQSPRKVELIFSSLRPREVVGRFEHLIPA